MYSFTKLAPSSQIQHASPTGKMPELVSFSVRFLEALPVLSESILNTSTGRILLFTVQSSSFWLCIPVIILDMSTVSQVLLL